MFLLLLSLAVLSVHGQNTEVETLRKKVALLTETFEKFQAKVEALEHVEDDHETRLKLMATSICFSAVKIFTQSVAQGDAILFDEEVIDTHDSYNPAYGTFVVPQDGIYEVTVTIYKSTSSSYNGMKFNVYLFNIFLSEINVYFGSDTAASTHSTSTIIREFRALDSVQVRAGSSGSVYGGTASKASQFSAKYLGEAP